MDSVVGAIDRCEGQQEERNASEESFLDIFSDFVTQRDFDAAFALCKERLKANPDDRYALQMQQTLLEFNTKADDLGQPLFLKESSTAFSELEQRATLACDRAFEAMFAYLQDADRLWYLGEQAVGIFWDPGQSMQLGPQRDHVIGMARKLLEVLIERLKKEGQHAGGSMPGGACVIDGIDEGTAWLFEGLGQLWFTRAIGLPCPSWLVEGCRKEWDLRNGSMATLVQCSYADLPKASLGELCDLTCTVGTLEKSIVCDIFDGQAPVAKLEYGIEAILAEILRRPLIEAPNEGFFDCFYLMTHVVYIMNSYNGCLPNHRLDCPWLYAYLERCLKFWLWEVKQAPYRSASEAHSAWASEAIDAIAEAMDYLIGLNEDKVTDDVCEGVQFLLVSQEADGFFYSPGSERDDVDAYNFIHPTWTAVSALQLKRQLGIGHTQAKTWVDYVRAIAKKISFSAY